MTNRPMIAKTAAMIAPDLVLGGTTITGVEMPSVEPVEVPSDADMLTRIQQLKGDPVITPLTQPDPSVLLGPLRAANAAASTAHGEIETVGVCPSSEAEFDEVAEARQGRLG